MERSRLPAAVRALRHRNYRLFFVGQLISLTGTWMQSVAQSWLVYRMTGSSLPLGMVGFAGQIPVFLFAPIGGAIADRFPRRRILIGTQLASMTLALALGVLTLGGWIEVWSIGVFAALLGVINALDVPTRQSFVVEMVGREDLPNAIALNSSMFNGARMVGPALAGAMVALVGEGWCFVANALSYLAVIYGLSRMRLAKAEPTRSEGSAVSQIVEGFRFVAQASPIRSLLLLLAVASLLGTPYNVLMPIFAGRIFHAGSSGLGLLMGSVGVGALLAAVLLATRRETHGLARWIAFACGGFGTALIFFSLSRSLLLSAAILVLVGFSLMLQMASSNTLIQLLTPDPLRGRVMAMYSMTLMGLAPFGALLAGGLADRYGAPATVAAGGAACILGAITFGFRLPTLGAEGYGAQETVGSARPGAAKR